MVLCLLWGFSQSDNMLGVIQFILARAAARVHTRCFSLVYCWRVLRCRPAGDPLALCTQSTCACCISENHKISRALPDLCSHMLYCLSGSESITQCAADAHLSIHFSMTLFLIILFIYKTHLKKRYLIMRFSLK